MVHHVFMIEELLIVNFLNILAFWIFWEFSRHHIFCNKLAANFFHLNFYFI